MWLNRWTSPAKRGLIFVCVPGHVFVSLIMRPCPELLPWQENRSTEKNWRKYTIHSPQTVTHTQKDMVWEDYSYTQYIYLHIHRLNTSHSQCSVCLWQLESPRLSVRNLTYTHTQAHKDTFNVKTAVLAVQSPSIKGVTPQESFHLKVWSNYHQRNSLHSHPPLSSCAGPAPLTHWRVIIDAWMEMQPLKAAVPCQLHLCRIVASPWWTGTLLAIFTISNGGGIRCSVLWITGQFVLNLLCSGEDIWNAHGFFHAL